MFKSPFEINNIFTFLVIVPRDLGALKRFPAYYDVAFVIDRYRNVAYQEAAVFIPSNTKDCIEKTSVVKIRPYVRTSNLAEKFPTVPSNFLEFPYSFLFLLL